MSDSSGRRITSPSRDPSDDELDYERFAPDPPEGALDPGPLHDCHLHDAWKEELYAYELEARGLAFWDVADWLLDLLRQETRADRRDLVMRDAQAAIWGYLEEGRRSAEGWLKGHTTTIPGLPELGTVTARSLEHHNLTRRSAPQEDHRKRRQSRLPPGLELLAEYESIRDDCKRRLPRWTSHATLPDSAFREIQAYYPELGWTSKLDARNYTPGKAARMAIAARYGVSPDTVKARIAEARKAR
jgi:hypothetical protein